MAAHSFKPDGYNSLSPYFIIDGAQKFIDLLSFIFDATVCRRFDLPGGKIMHAEVRIDDTIVMVADSNKRYPPNTTVVHVYVADVALAFNRAINAGCEGIETPTRKNNDPDIRGTFKDFAGNLWSVGSQQ